MGQKKRKGIIVVATSRRTRGGVTAVVKAYENAKALRDYRLRWVETHIDRNPLLKLTYFFFALFHYGLLLPFNRVVHIHISSPVSAFRKLFFLLPAKFLGKKIITHIHCDISETHIQNSSFVAWIYTLFFHCSHHILVLSEAWKKYLTDIGKLKATIEVLYNPACSVTPRLLAEEQKYILFMGSLIPRKRWFDLLRAFRHIADTHPDWQLIFGGSGSLAEGKQLSESLGLAKQVEFQGWVDSKEKQELFRKAAIVCLPSYSEGFPMAVVEAWAYGLPVVCTSVGGLSDVIRDEETALLVEIGDIKCIAQQLERLISDVDLRKRLGDAGHELAVNVFGLPYISRRLASVYESLLKP
ncbi:MAG: glycosyltransferase family 4 protein [Tannerellaceae bacterium]|jgi:glycosyltransferase involved in cell wall biosynthesis|nr:glycosyltransferase family 4 protein [Tannerellaceae bacterium]